MATNESAIIRAKNMLIQQCMKNEDNDSESSIRNKLPRKHVRISIDPSRLSDRLKDRSRNSEISIPGKIEEQWSGLIRSKSTDLLGSSLSMKTKRPSSSSQRSTQQEMNCYVLDNFEPLDSSVGVVSSSHGTVNFEI